MIQSYPFQQTAGDDADPSVGGPRVTLLCNGLLDRAGRIVRTPAWDDGWHDDEGGTEITGRKYHVGGGRLGRGTMLHEEDGPGSLYPAYPLKSAMVNAAGGWVKNPSADHVIVPVTGPRAADVVTAPGRTVYGGQLLTPTDNANARVVIGESYNGTIYQLEMRLLMLNAGQLQAVSDPTITDSMAWAQATPHYPKAVGSWLVFNAAATVRIFEYSLASGWTQRFYASCGYSTRLDAAYNATDGKIHLVNAQGFTNEIDTTAWTATGWTDRSAAFTSPQSGSYSIAYSGGTVWIAATCTGPVYKLISWDYPGWTTVQTQTTVLSAPYSINYICQLSPGVAATAEDSDPRVWVTGQVQSKATNVLMGSLGVQSWSNDLTLGAGCDLELTDCLAATTVLDAGEDGAWLVVGTIREFVRQAWLVWLDKGDDEEYGYQDTMVCRGAAPLWRGRMPVYLPSHGQTLETAEFGADELGERNGLIWCAATIVDGDASWTAGEDATGGLSVACVEGHNASSVTGFFDATEATDWPPELFLDSSAQGGQLLGAGVPVAIGHSVELCGFLEQPPAPVCANSASGAVPAAGTRSYVVACRAIDSLGRLHIGPVSRPHEFTSDGHYVDITLRGMVHHPGIVDARMHVYVTVDGGNTYYRGTPAEGVAWLNCEDSNATFTYDVSDADLVTRPLLYTQGTLSADGETALLEGRLECWGPPACRWITAGTVRAMAGGLERATQVQFSNLFFPREAPGWPTPTDPSAAGFAVDLPEAVTAGAMVDDVAIVWTRLGAYYIAGAGPDVHGQGEFDPPRRIADAPGALSQQSVVDTPQGPLWQAPDLQYWLLQRGTMQAVQVSSAWSERIAGTHSWDGDTYDIDHCAVVGGVYNEQSELVFLARRAVGQDAADAGLGGTVVYDPALRTWSVETDTGEGARHCGMYSCAGVKHVGVLTYLEVSTTDVALTPKTQGESYSQYDSHDVTNYRHRTIAKISHVEPWQPGGRGVVRCIGLLASTDRGRSHPSAGDTTLYVQVRYDGEQSTAFGNSFSVAPGSPYDSEGTWVYQVAPGRIQCAEMEVIFHDLAASRETWWNALVVDADPDPGFRVRQRAGNDRG